MARQEIGLRIDEEILCSARQYADEEGTTLEALLTEHVTLLADRAGRRLTVREQTYADYRPPEEVVEALRAEGLGQNGKAH
jgi:hypothetical protein